ncbi:MAG: SIMPL domain-containing protein [Candidatus Eisenbacteria bacterium]|nr:SIMPL domain-containing protein [Candidatus Eisenbacteria bacterium]
MKRFDALVLALALVVGATVLGAFFYGARSDDESIAVVGVATQRVSSDIVKWRISLARSLSPSAVADGYGRMAADARAVTDALTAAGIAAADITVHPISIFRNYAPDGTVPGYTAGQSITVTSKELDRVESLATNPAALIGGGVLLQGSDLEFYVSDLAAVKQTLLAAATRDAMARAEEMARSAERRLGRMLAARSGVFQFTEPYSSEVSDYGIFSTSTREKDATVTVRAAFALR